MQNYKKIYTSITKKPIPKGFDIHHIDMNRNNNSIENLVMLPKELHRQYHQLILNIPNTILFNTTIQSLLYGGNAYNDFLLSNLIAFNDVKKECDKWCDYRDYLLGLLPNIHNIEVDYGNI